MKERTRSLATLPACTCLIVFLLAVVPFAGAEDAKQIVGASGIKGGLIVHLGCGDGKLTAALRVNDSFLVHGLDADPANVATAREHIRSLGLYGKVSVDIFDGQHLPYADNLVNLIVISGEWKVANEEIMRILAPGGVALLVNPKSAIQNPKLTKPQPKDTDEWTHYLYDATGNAVSHDLEVGPPRRVQWIGQPRHSRSHEYTPSIFAVVSTRGRIFYVVDETNSAFMRDPSTWRLVARDAYNGVVLWKRPIETWFPHICGWTAGPLQLQRKVVAVGNRVYAALGFHAPLSVLDAATGETIKVYDGTDGTEEILVHKGILLLVVRSVSDERVAQLKNWLALEKEKKSPLDDRDAREPVFKQFRAAEVKAPVAILALDAESGRALWKQEDFNAFALKPLTLSAVGDRVFYQKGKDVVCLDLKTGKELWSAPATPMRVACDKAVICADNQTITALSAEDGKTLWAQDLLLCSVRDVFIIHGAIWVGGFKPWEGRTSGKRGPPWGPYFVVQHDMATGKVLKEINPEGPGHHHRCWGNKATDRFIIGGRRGAEFIDLKSGEVFWNSWVRGVCRYGTMPANGLLYAPSHACGCYIAAKLTGFYVLAPQSQKSEVRDQKSEIRGQRSERVEKGPAFGEMAYGKLRAPQSDDWPTYRRDASRSGATKSAVPTDLKQMWAAKIGGPLSSLTLADGRVFVAAVDQHTLHALDAVSGQPVWNYTAGGRIDSPPTVHNGRAILGCRDGYVYSLRASDGALAWRLRAAREDRRVPTWGQIESVSPVSGSVLVQDGMIYLGAGRSSYLDAGIDVLRVRPETGEVLSTTPIYSPDPETGKQPEQDGPCYMPGALEDILTGDGQCVYLRDIAFNKEGVPQEEVPPHLLALTGFLDETWAHRSYWGFGTRSSLKTGCSPRDKDLVFGRLLVVDGPMIYGYGRADMDWSNQLQDKPYRLFALKQDADDEAEEEQWTKSLPIHVRAMVLADKTIFAAGPEVDAQTGGFGKGAMLLAISAADGAELARYPLASAPVWDGMIAAGGRLFLALADGSVACLGK
ncbi:MAG: PQQ-binding-like beta-propeller repeat protein [Planctomycetota bacterium]